MTEEIRHAAKATIEAAFLAGHSSPALRRLQFALDAFDNQRLSWSSPDFWHEIALVVNLAYRATLSKMLTILFLVATDESFAANHAEAHSATARLRLIGQGLSEMAAQGLVVLDQPSEPTGMHS